jgi:transcriptional regulator with XRE-family HTH domain
LTTISKLAEKLRDPEYRKAFVASQMNIGLPFQLRALLKARGKTQDWLAEKAGMLQPRISGLLNPGKTRPNIETLRRLAEAFDCGLAVRFVPFSELARWSERFDPESFEVPEFDKDTGFQCEEVHGYKAGQSRLETQNSSGIAQVGNVGASSVGSIAPATGTLEPGLRLVPRKQPGIEIQAAIGGATAASAASGIHSNFGVVS